MDSFQRYIDPLKGTSKNHISLERIHQSPSELNPGVSRKADVNSLEGERVCLQIPYLPWFINVPSSCMVYLFTIFVFSWFIIISPSAYPSFGNKKNLQTPKCNIKLAINLMNYPHYYRMKYHLFYSHVYPFKSHIWK